MYVLPELMRSDCLPTHIQGGHNKHGKHGERRDIHA